MHPVLELLEERGLVFPDLLRHELLHSRSLGEVERTAEDLRRIVLSLSAKPTNTPDGFDPFSFLASATLRGDIGCSECRWEKLEDLARYSVLYATQIAVPINFNIACPAGSGEHFRSTVADRIAEILIFRPAIDAGIVALLPGGFDWCEKHLTERFPDYERFRGIKEQLCDESRPKFSMRVSNGGAGHLTTELEGPTEFLEHGFLATHHNSTPKWLPPRCVPGTQIQLTKREIKESKVVDILFERIARDVFVHKIYGEAIGATYLTDLAGEASFLQRTSDDSRAFDAAMACKTLTHSIPMFADLPMDTIVRLRREEPEAFLRYRAALSGVIRDHVQGPQILSVREARAIYADWLKPELDSLEAVAKKKWEPLRRISRRAIVTAAVVALGLYTKILTSDAPAILKALGLSAVANAVDGAIDEVEGAPSEIKKHNLYFLLRAQREQER